MSVRIAFTGGLLPRLALEEDIELAARAGYDGLELWVPKLWPLLEERGPSGVVSLLRHRRLPAFSVAPIPDVTFRDVAGSEEVAAAVHRLAEVARAVSAPWLVLLPGARPDGVGDRDAEGEARETFLRLCRISERYDVGLAVTPLGSPRASIRTLKQGARVVESVGRRSVALCLDTRELSASESCLDDLRACHSQWLALVRWTGAAEPAGGKGHDARAFMATMVEVLTTLGTLPPWIIQAPPQGGEEDPVRWARQLREEALAILAEPSARRSR